MNGKVSWKLVSCVLALTLLVTGCWSNREVEDLAIIMLVGFDKISEDGTENWRVSSRIFKPEAAQQKGEVSKGTREILVQGTGRTIQEADLDFFKRIPRFPFYGDLNSFIIGEEVAKENIEDVLSIHLAHVEDRPRTFMLVTQGEAIDILSAKPDMAASLSKEITGLAEEKARKFGTSMGVTSAEFIECLLSEDRDPIATAIHVVYPEKTEDPGDKTIAVEGFGVFRGANLVGWLNQEQATGMLFLCQKDIKDASIIIPVQADERFTYTATSSKSKIKPKFKNGKLSFTVTIKVKGSIRETGGIEVTSENLEQVSGFINEEIQRMCMDTIAQAKELNSDFLGLMQKFHQGNPKAWQEVRENWREEFQKAEIEVIVDSQVINTGRIIKRLEIKDSE